MSKTARLAKPSAVIVDIDGTLVIVSGLSELAREDTELWLTRHLGVPFEGPFMRPARDDRKDEAIMREIYDHEIAPRFDVLCVLNDRDQVVRMWRALGLVCLQVAPGDF